MLIYALFGANRFIMRSLLGVLASVVFVFAILTLGSCVVAETTAVPPLGVVVGYESTPESTSPANGVDVDLPPIALPISAYIIEDEDGLKASSRDQAGVSAIFERANEIWAQAQIVIEVQSIRRLTLPDDVVQAIEGGDFRPFFSGIDNGFSIPEPSLLNAFFASDIGGPNGIAPIGSNLLFVTDEPTVHDYRVTAHEIGHLLGLHHVTDDSQRLMFSGTNGTFLTDEEIVTARYIARGMLQGLR